MQRIQQREASVVIKQGVSMGKWTLGSLGMLWVAWACAGGDTPPRDQDLLDRLLLAFPEDAVGVAGSVNMAGAGGGGGSGQGGGGGQGGGASGAGGGVSGGAGGGSSGASGSGNSGASGSGAVMSCAWSDTVLGIACGIGSGCHGADSALGDFGASEADAEALIGVTTRNGCGPYIDANNPEQSQIFTKLGDDRGASCGAQMPFLIDPLSQEEQDCILGWLQSL